MGLVCGTPASFMPDARMALATTIAPALGAGVKNGLRPNTGYLSTVDMPKNVIIYTLHNLPRAFFFRFVHVAFGG